MVFIQSRQVHNGHAQLKAAGSHVLPDRIDVHHGGRRQEALPGVAEGLLHPSQGWLVDQLLIALEETVTVVEVLQQVWLSGLDRVVYPFPGVQVRLLLRLGHLRCGADELGQEHLPLHVQAVNTELVVP